MKLIRDSSIEETGRKALGMGFIDLVEGARSEIGVYNLEGDIEKIRKLFDLAIQAEDTNNIIDALFYYRYIVEIFNEKNGKEGDTTSFIGLSIVLKAMNNIGGICYDLDQKNESNTWFKRILIIDPENSIAKENLETLKLEL